MCAIIISAVRGLLGTVSTSAAAGTNAVHPNPSVRILLALLSALGLCMLAPEPVQAQPVEWTQLQPTQRSGPAMAYDSARGVTVLFGGLASGGTRSSETWEWNGGAGGVWAQRAVGSLAAPPMVPSPRFRHAMAYDSNRGVTVLFGGSTGFTGDTPNGETWEWNGSAWTQRVVNGPSPRYEHAMAYDATRGVTVLFGGTTGSAVESGETWEWDGTAWTLRIVSGPSPRRQHAMAYDAARGVTVLFGGLANGSENSETWEWNGTAWTQRMVSGSLSPRRGHSMVYDSARGVAVLFGGYTGSNYSNETWEWNGASGKSAGTWTRRAVSGPPSPSPRYQCAMTHDSARGVTVLFGGFTGGTNDGQTWEWNGSGESAGGAWSLRIASGPPARYFHSMAYDTARSVAVLFGGVAASQDTNDTWEWSGTDGQAGQGAWTRRTPSGSSPSPRRDFAMAYHATAGVTLLFGGDTGSPNAETWQWNGAAGGGAGTWTPRPVSGPSARSGHAMAYDSARGVTVLFGGNNFISSNGQTWEWDGNVWTQRTVVAPSPRYRHAMAYDATRGVTVLFGGVTNGGPNGETWEWDGIAWTQRMVTSSPAPRYGHSMAYDAARGVAVLFGGAIDQNTRSNETWEWNGNGTGEWAQRVISGPSPRNAFAMAYDTARGTTVLFGGIPGGGETWQLRAACAVPSALPVADTVCSGGSISFSVTATGDGPIAYQWRKNAVNLTNEPNHISGAQNATLFIINTAESDEGSYTCVITNAGSGGCGSITSNSASLNIGASCPADFNCDGTVNSGDFFDYLTAFFTSPPVSTADFNHDGSVNSQDFFDFIAAFFAGC